MNSYIKNVYENIDGEEIIVLPITSAKAVFDENGKNIADLVKEAGMAPATSETLGTVKPDNNSILVNEADDPGAIEVNHNYLVESITRNAQSGEYNDYGKNEYIYTCSNNGYTRYMNTGHVSVGDKLYYTVEGARAQDDSDVDTTVSSATYDSEYRMTSITATITEKDSGYVYENWPAWAKHYSIGEIISEIDAKVDVATSDKAGIVKPDGTTITVTEDGTLSADQTFASEFVKASEVTPVTEYAGTASDFATRARNTESGTNIDAALSTINNTLGVVTSEKLKKVYGITTTSNESINVPSDSIIGVFVATNGSGASIGIYGEFGGDMPVSFVSNPLNCSYSARKITVPIAYTRYMFMYANN